MVPHSVWYCTVPYGTTLCTCMVPHYGTTLRYCMVPCTLRYCTVPYVYVCVCPCKLAYLCRYPLAHYFFLNSLPSFLIPFPLPLPSLLLTLHLPQDLCDIEDELETKLGVFNVHINGEPLFLSPRPLPQFHSKYITCLSCQTGLVGLGRSGSGDTFEAQLKLGTQKWKARCKTSRQQQIWQDADVSDPFLE